MIGRVGSSVRIGFATSRQYGAQRSLAEAVAALATPELETLVAARRVLAPNYALHVAVEETKKIPEDCLCFDELGYVPFAKAGAELLFDLVARGSIRLAKKEATSHYRNKQQVSL